MRWSITLDSPTLAARPWQEVLSPDTHEASVVLRLGPDDEGRRADVAIEAGPAGLRVAALAEGCAGGARPAHPEWYFRDHLAVFVNPGHDHATRWAVPFASDDVVALGGDSLGHHLQRNLLAGMLGQSLPFLPRHVGRWNVEIPVLDEGKRIHAASQRWIP